MANAIRITQKIAHIKCDKRLNCHIKIKTVIF